MILCDILECGCNKEGYCLAQFVKIRENGMCGRLVYKVNGQFFSNESFRDKPSDNLMNIFPLVEPEECGVADQEEKKMGLNEGSENCDIQGGNSLESA